ncbi:MAG: RNA-binding S4 domain-containing protein [Clostridiales bacterium]|uniref:RNA-binding S4 domain-containing protein n=1 Tax=Provencibacterium massiliense TaxID=1841868 RepID=UPI0009A7509D|nr:RNA-binding S4 domain-containing protein [Provencibacterium massiliense]PWM37971.1 MAG: RNA-binding S4 domain-containing protein [Clostridiales bacterium]RGB68953.1 RNA-binding S4 domain-containing protein [Harryflintia acetispora]
MQKIKVPIRTEYIKMDSLLKFAGVADTGGMAKEIIEQGEITLDGETVVQRGKKVRPGMTVQVGLDVLIEVTSA